MLGVSVALPCRDVPKQLEAYRHKPATGNTLAFLATAAFALIQRRAILEHQLSAPKLKATHSRRVKPLEGEECVWRGQRSVLVLADRPIRRRRLAGLIQIYDTKGS